jgi:hypothetical protein
MGLDDRSKTGGMSLDLRALVERVFIWLCVWGIAT